jgi:hypothetical protein
MGDRGEDENTISTRMTDSHTQKEADDNSASYSRKISHQILTTCCGSLNFRILFRFLLSRSNKKKFQTSDLLAATDTC